MTDEQLPTQTTDAGIPVESDKYSLTVGAGGPILLQDSYQVGVLVRQVMDDAARDRLVANTVAQLLNGVTEPVRLRAFGYLRKVDQSLGDRVEKGVRQRPPA